MNLNIRLAEHHEESTPRRWVFWVLAMATAAAFFLISVRFFVPAHGGVDQNGYLVGGKQLAEFGSMALAPRDGTTGRPDPYQFVGRMWIGSDLGSAAERYYPKYPFGLPLLVAAAVRLGGSPAAYWISPCAMALAVLATFFLARMIAGSFMGWLAMAVVASSPITMTLATNPNSHAATLCCVAWGMYFVLRWCREQGRSWWFGMSGAFLLGFAAAIRYTEGLLVVPLLLAAWTVCRGKPWRTWADAALVLGAWAFPLGVLALHNYAAFGHLTGYDPCNESTGFAWEYFCDNWETMLRQIDNAGLFFVFPVAAAGLVLMFWSQRMTALILATWIVPCMLVYSFYYWAPDGLGYMRFFLTILPALAVCAFWLLNHAGHVLAAAGGTPARFEMHSASAAAAGCLASVALLANVAAGLQGVESDAVNRSAIAAADRVIRSVAPPGSLLFLSDGGLMHQLQFTGDYFLYNQEAFDRRTIQQFKKVQPDEPQGFQPQRQQLLVERFGEYTQAQFTKAQQLIVKAALAGSHRVFFVRRLDTQPRPRVPAAPRPSANAAGPAVPAVPAAVPAAVVPAPADIVPPRPAGGAAAGPAAMPFASPDLPPAFFRTSLLSRELFPSDQFVVTPVASWCVVTSMPNAKGKVKPRNRKPVLAASPGGFPQPVIWQLVEVTPRKPLRLEDVLASMVEKKTAPARPPKVPPGSETGGKPHAAK